MQKIEFASSVKATPASQKLETCVYDFIAALPAFPHRFVSFRAVCN